MADCISYFLRCGFEMLKIYIILQYLTDLAVRPKRWRVIGASIVLLGTVVLYSVAGYQLMTYLISCVATVLVLFKDRLYKCIVFAIWAVFTISYIDQVSSYLFRGWLNGMEITWSIVQIVFFNAVTILILILLAFVIYHIYGNRMKVGVGYYFLFVIICAVNGILMISYMNGVRWEYGQIPFSQAVAITVVGMSPILEMILILMLAATNKINCEKMQISRKYLEIQQEHYAYLEKKQKEIRSFRHDMNDHINSVSMLLQHNDVAEAVKYLESINGVLYRTKVFTVNNDIADGIIQYYSEICMEKNIALNVCGAIPKVIRIAAFDLCTILSNVLKNAIEGVVQCKNPTIELHIAYEKGNLLLFEKNPYQGELVVKDGVVQTRKRDKEQHGYGLSNIQKVVERYKGDMLLEAENGHFCIRIRLPDLCMKENIDKGKRT